MIGPESVSASAGASGAVARQLNETATGAGQALSTPVHLFDDRLQVLLQVAVLRLVRAGCRRCRSLGSHER
eukprot:7581334-Alexandrium_andersonii.AAC.1